MQARIISWATHIIAAAGMALFASAPVYATGDDCLGWDKPVTLEGFIIEGTFPGPPEYESVASGDAELQATLLYLSEPVCLPADPDMDVEAIAATELIQLACPDAMISTRGETITLQGKLFAAHTGYHVTPALLSCSQ